MASPHQDPHPSNVPSPDTLPPLAGSTLVIRGQFAHTLGGSNFDSGPSDLVSTLDLTSAIPAGTGSQAYFTSSRPIPLRVADPLVAFSPRGRIRLAGGSTHNSSNLWAPNVRGLFEYDADRDVWATLVPASDASASSDAQPQPLLPMGCSIPTTLFASTGSLVGQVVYGFGGVIDGTGPNPTYVDELRRVSMLDGSVTVEVLPKRGGGSEWPAARASALVLPINDTHLMLSGGVGVGRRGLKDWWVYEIGKGVWSKGSSELTAARYSHRAVLYDERHVIQSGGWLDNASAPLLESIDLFTGTVTPIVTQLTPGEADESLAAKHLTRHNTVLAGDQLLMYGGYAEYNDSLPVFKHNRRLYVASLASSSANGLTATWQSAYRPTLLLPPNYLRNGKPGDHAPWYAVGIVLVAMVVSTLVLASVRGRLIGSGARDMGTGQWWMWWRKVSTSIGRKRWRQQRQAAAERVADQDDDDEDKVADEFASAMPTPPTATSLVTANEDDQWPERNQSRRPRLSIFTTASTSSSLSPKSTPHSARTPPTRPASSSFGHPSATTAASSSTTSPASKPTVSVLPTPSMVRRGVGERVISVPEIVDPLPVPIPPVSAAPAGEALGLDAGAQVQRQGTEEDEMGTEGQVRELQVRPVVVGGSFGSSKSASEEGAMGYAQPVDAAGYAARNGL
ncbi:hypothetical protein BCR44DRAFT_59824 [Catenaria anguillulae PL171]|uniref:Galactose oxidase n=1 Tax=Catenaria anguillulae PL171 TaxID=765915 RepID=A0A1Y2HS98_9FUNG|nr:hypothetical protein BCR44DRAFT_59824 [Catenaria anguillulae PL171]